MLQLTYELRPKWKNKNNKTKSQNAVSRSDPLQGSDKKFHIPEKAEEAGGSSRISGQLCREACPELSDKSQRAHVLLW